MVKGSKHTKETRLKLSSAHSRITYHVGRFKVGEKLRPEIALRIKKIRNTTEWKEKVFTDERNKKISTRMSGKKPLNFGKDWGGSGENNVNWKGGISKTKEYRAHWRQLMQSKRRGATGKHSLDEWQSLKAKYGFMCLCCKQNEPFVSLTKDHVIPISKGGTNDIGNIQPLCAACNLRKFTKTVDYRTTPWLVKEKGV